MEDARQGENRTSDQRQHFIAKRFLLSDKAATPLYGQPNFRTQIHLTFLIKRGKNESIRDATHCLLKLIGLLVFYF